MPIDNAYESNHNDFEIRNIVYEEDAKLQPPIIQFEYKAPAISVDTAGRFAKHEIIGGATVRQKIGEDPIEVDVGGVCQEPTARKIDALRDAKFGDIYSNRFVGGSMTVQFASASTSPMEDSGAVALADDGQEFLYTYDLSCVEVVVGAGEGDARAGDEGAADFENAPGGAGGDISDTS